MTMLRALLAICLLATAVVACGTTNSGGSITVLGPWSGTEGEQFDKVVLAKFRRDYHINVTYQGTRAVGQVLQNDVSNHNPPDIAILPSAAPFATYAANGSLQPLDKDVPSNYSPQWQGLTSVGGRRYAVVVKADLKSIVWYDPPRLDPFLQGGTPTTWAQLVALGNRITTARGTPWCLGVEANSTSGWPGTDWIEDIVLHEFGQGFYMDWVNGGTSWTDDRIALAWFQWRRDMVTSANSSAALFTGFDAAGKSMFAPRPGCYLDHEGSFIVDNYPRGAADYFQFPTFDGSGNQAMEVSADLAGRFGTSDAARNLMKFLASDDAQRIWPGIPGSGAFSVDRNVGPTVYQDAIARKVAGKLTGTDTLCFDASDLMPDELTGAFYQAVLRYLADPSKLESLLQQLELTSKNVHNGHTTAFQCGLARH